ncbi:hypothetical protein B0H14DRAFT_2640672 [Mycena olivaceomarginata]|nr:hypothetical protein B0H14DRAFT_2640672 [Mycena olivaceomarginata]
MSDTKLTPAEKRRNTLAAKAERERQEQAAFVAKSSNVWSSCASTGAFVTLEGGRKAKVEANEKAGREIDTRVFTFSVWKVDQKATRKRALSTAQASETIKKARGTETISEYVPANIEDSDESAPEQKKTIRIDFTKLVSFDSAKAKTVVAKGLKVLPRIKSVKQASAAKTVPARIVAESASDDDAVSSEEHSDEAGSAQSDEEAQDVSP